MQLSQSGCPRPDGMRSGFGHAEQRLGKVMRGDPHRHHHVRDNHSRSAAMGLDLDVGAPLTSFGQPLEDSLPGEEVSHSDSLEQRHPLLTPPARPAGGVSRRLEEGAGRGRAAGAWMGPGQEGEGVSHAPACDHAGRLGPMRECRLNKDWTRTSLITLRPVRVQGLSLAAAVPPSSAPERAAPVGTVPGAGRSQDSGLLRHSPARTVAAAAYAAGASRHRRRAEARSTTLRSRRGWP